MRTRRVGSDLSGHCSRGAAAEWCEQLTPPDESVGPALLAPQQKAPLFDHRRHTNLVSIRHFQALACSVHWRTEPSLFQHSTRRTGNLGFESCPRGCSFVRRPPAARIQALTSAVHSIRTCLCPGCALCATTLPA